ncbi:MAG: hypothetical protein ACI936_000459 [Paraglaciecola sp.]|jgi:hypothetical protein
MKPPLWDSLPLQINSWRRIMNNATFHSLSNTLTITLTTGKVIKKTFASKNLFSSEKSEKIEMLKKYIVGFLQITNVALSIK